VQPQGGGTSTDDIEIPLQIKPAALGFDLVNIIVKAARADSRCLVISMP